MNCISQLQGVTHEITQCYIPPSQVNTVDLNHSLIDRYSIYLPGRVEGWVDLQCRWLVTYGDGLPAHRRSPIQAVHGRELNSDALTTTQHQANWKVSQNITVYTGQTVGELYGKGRRKTYREWQEKKQQKM